jgi:hypothetical protein
MASPVLQWYKVTFFYTVNTYGFSESWYVPSGTTYLAVLNQCYAYISRRMACSGAQTFCTYFRVSSIFLPTTRTAAVFTANPNGGSVQGTFNAFNSETDDASVAILVKCYASTNNFVKNWYMRGIPDVEVEQGGLIALDPTFRLALGTLGTFLFQSQWGWLASVRPATLTGPIQSITQGPTGQVFFTMNVNITPPGYGQNQDFQARCSGAKGVSNLNGPLTIYSSGVTGLSYGTRDVIWIGSLYVPLTGTLTVRTPTLVAVNVPTLGGIQAFRVVTRKAGRPSYQSPGRRRNRLVKA